MDLKQLEYFLRVAELGSFTKASRVLDVAQPAISRQVRMLEVELGRNLLNRNGRGVTTTDAGELLLRHARGILHQVDRAYEDMNRVQGALAGHVVLGSPPSVSRAMTVELVRAFASRLPNATLSISEGLSSIMRQWLLAGHLDIAMLYNPVPSAELDLLPLTSESLYLVGLESSSAPETPCPVSQLAGVPLVIPSRPNTIRMLVETQMALVGCKPNIRLEIDSVPAILDLVADGAGYAILTEHAVATSAHPDRFHLRTIVDPGLTSHLYMATSSAHALTLTQKTALEVIRATASDVYPTKAARSGEVTMLR